MRFDLSVDCWRRVVVDGCEAHFESKVLDERNAKVIIQIPKYRSECRNVCATADPLSEIKNCLLTAFSTFTDVGILIARDYSSPKKSQH